MRPFDTATTVENGVIVLRLTGELDASDSPGLVEVFGALGTSAEGVVIDLSDCDFIDSAGIAAIVDAWRAHNENGGGSVALAAPSGQVDRIIRITGLAAYIPVFIGLDEALAAVPRDGMGSGNGPVSS